MVVLVVVLLVTNLASLGTLLYFLYGPEQQPTPDETVAAAIDRSTPRVASSTTRRVITIEILNPLELAGTRGRFAGLAGSLAPGLTRRIVYDQAVRTVKRQLAEERVVADVRVHTLRPVPAEPRVAAPVTTADEPIPYFPEEEPVDLTKRPDRPTHPPV